jgi:hypothetical protein
MNIEELIARRPKAELHLHIEGTLDPEMVTALGRRNNMTLEYSSVKAVPAAKREFNMTSKLIMCFLRHLLEEVAFDTLNQALPFKDVIHGVGLDSGEPPHPPEKFVRVYAQVRKQGYLPVEHAGEEGPVEYARDALEILFVPGERIFEAFEKRMAVPLVTQDFKASDGKYMIGEASIHPAHPIHMTPRHLAFFALLYLREGRWRERQMLSHNWVKERTTG